MRWVVNATPRPLYPRETPGTNCIGDLGPRAGLDGCGKSRPQRDSIPGPSSPWGVAIPTELSRPTKHTCPPVGFEPTISTGERPLRPALTGRYVSVFQSNIFLHLQGRRRTLQIERAGLSETVVRCHIPEHVDIIKFYLYQRMHLFLSYTKITDYSSRLHTARITDTQNICCHMTTMQFV